VKEHSYLGGHILGSNIRIRAHHLLCIQGYQGYGYSSGFADGFGMTRDTLYGNDPIIRIIEGVDDICSVCPNLHEGQCSEYSGKVLLMDRTILGLLGISNGTTMRFKEALDLVRSHLTEKDIKEICNGCRWKGVCLFYQDRAL